MQCISQLVQGTLPMTSHADRQTTHEALNEKIKSHRARDKETEDITGDGIQERIG